MATGSRTSRFDRTNFDVISGLIESNDDMKGIEKVVEENRKKIFDILSNGRANGNTVDDENSLKRMKDALDKKQGQLQDDLGKIADFDISGDNKNDDLVKYCKSIYAPKDSTKVDTALATKCGDLLSYLQKVYNQGASTEKLFSGRKDDAADSLSKLIASDRFKKIINSKKDSSLQSNIDDFIDHVLISKDNSFGITISKLYSKEQAQVAARIAVFLHCMQKALKDGRVADIAKVQTIINVLENEQIPKIRGLFNLQKEQKAVDAEYETLVDIRKNDIAEIVWDDTTPNIDLTDSFESKSTGKAKDLNLYNIDKEEIKINISGTEYTKDDLILKDSAGETDQINVSKGSKSGDFRLYVKISGNEVEVGTLNIDYKSTPASFIFGKNPNFLDELSSKSISVTGDIDVNIPIMAVKKVSPVTNTGWVSLTRTVKSSITGGTVIPPIPTPTPTPTTVDDLEINAAVSDMESNVIKEKVALEVEKEMEEEYKEIAKLDVIKRARFFFGREIMRKKRINKRMDEISGKVFTGDSVLDSQLENATDRHQFEQDKGLGSGVNKVATYENNIDLNNLCKEYLDGTVDDAQFQNRFNDLIENGSAKDIKSKVDVKHIGTNLLLKMKQQKAWKNLIEVVEADLDSYVSTGATETSYTDNIEQAIKEYIKMYQDNATELLGKYNDYMGDKADTAKLDKLKDYLSHQKAIMSLTANNIKIRLNILEGGKSAYQINNEKREKSVFYRIGRRMDDHPWWTTGITAGLSVGLGLATGGLGTLAAASITTGGFATIVGVTNAAKKSAHYTKEQKTHEKNLVSDYDDEMRRIAEWNDIATNGHGWKKHKAKRQLKLYDMTTQNEIAMANNITENIMNLSSNVGSVDVNSLKLYLIEGWARLKYYKEEGHNFLASNEKTRTEEDMNRLEQAIFVGMEKLGSTKPEDIEGYTLSGHFSGTTIKFSDTYDKIKADFEKTNDTFKKRRRRLSATYGISTGAISGLTALGMQRLTHSGVFAGNGTEPVAGYSSSNTMSDSFDLGKHDFLDLSTKNQIYSGTQNAITPAPDGSTITIHYGAGTDATPFAPGRELTLRDLETKVDSIINEVNNTMNLGDNAKVFVNELENIKLGKGVGTNGYLQNMRHAEFLEQTAQALSDSGRAGSMVVELNHDVAGLDVVGTHLHDAGERVVSGLIDVSKAEIPGTEPKTWGRWLMGVPTFSNTFKDREAA